MANLEGLNPYVRQQAEKLIEASNARIVNGKYKVIIVQGYRSIAEQDALYAQGRTTKGDIVTNARGGQSMHNFGLGIDFALATLDGKKVSWDTKADFDNDGKADWMEVVSEAQKLGFEWGGSWTSFKDMPHFQMLGGLTEKEIRNGKTPKFPSLDDKIVAKPASTTTVKLKVVSTNTEKFNLPNEVYKKGDKGKEVGQIQEALNELNFKVGKVDNSYGSKTQDAILRFQKMYGIKEYDGVYGSKTRAKILEQLNK